MRSAIQKFLKKFENQNIEFNVPRENKDYIIETARNLAATIARVS